MDDDNTPQPAAGGPRSWWRRRWVLILVIAVVAGAGALYLLGGRYGARGWCDATNRVRVELGDAVTGLDTADEIFVAQVEVAAEEAPALIDRADRMIWPRGDLADRAAAALADVATTEIAGDQSPPLQQFLELDNEFRDSHCDSQVPL